MTREEAIRIIKIVLAVAEDFEITVQGEEFTKEKCKEAVEIVTKALEQEPCEMTAEEYRQRMIQAFHNADCDELIAICVLPTEKEFEHLEWLLEKHYKAKPQPCEDAISRECNNCAYYVNGANDEACDGCFADEYEHPNFKPKAQPCVDCVSRQSVIDVLTKTSGIRGDALKALYDLPPITPAEMVGHWIFVHPLQEDDGGGYMCSICNVGDWNLNGKENYCPNCGAKMREVEG